MKIFNITIDESLKTKLFRSLRDHLTVSAYNDLISSGKLTMPLSVFQLEVVQGVLLFIITTLVFSSHKYIGYPI